MREKKSNKMPLTSKIVCEPKQHSTKSSAKTDSMSLAKEWLMRFSEKHTESNSEYERWMNK